jgi:hypothetical protein
MVKWISKLAVAVLVVSVWASPVMACMLPEADLTGEELECCKSMADDCGRMAMPASHSCCKSVVRQADAYLINSRFPTVHSVNSVTLFVSTREHSLPATPLQANIMFAGHSPPTPPPEAIAILRI